MKYYFIILLYFLMVMSVFAEEETLVGNKFHSGGYGGFFWKIGSINGKSGIMAGGRGAWIINHKFAIGGGGSGLVVDMETNQLSENGKTLYLDVDWGGIEFEYIHDSDKMFHWTIHTLFGSGSARLIEHDPEMTFETDTFWLVEPSFNMDMNVFKSFRIGVGISYRATMNLSVGEISSADINGLSALIIFKFGSF